MSISTTTPVQLVYCVPRLVRSKQVTLWLRDVYRGSQCDSQIFINKTEFQRFDVINNYNDNAEITRRCGQKKHFDKNKKFDMPF